MGKLNAFFVEFQNSPCGVFYAGQTIFGQAVVDLREPAKARNVRVEFSGRAYTHWTESRTETDSEGKSQSHTDHYSDEECYLHQEIVLWGKPPGCAGDNPTLPAGRHVFPFTFLLRPDCPTSFEGRAYGHIRYYVKGTIDRPWRFDHTCKQPFTVVGLLDLNLDMSMGQALELHDGKTLGCLCCKAGQISHDIIVPQKGFVPGEMFRLTVCVDNKSERKISHVKAQLFQQVTFHASHVGRHCTKHSCDKIAEMTYSQELEAGEEREVTFDNFRIPPVPPTLLSCRIINITYYIKVQTSPTGPSTNLSTQIPITIGSIPLRRRFGTPQPALPPHGAYAPGFEPQPPGVYAPGLEPSPPGFAAPLPGTANPSAPPFMQDYPDLPPPSYEECVTGGNNVREEGDNEHTRGNLDFVPRYPCFPSAPPMGQ